MTAKTLGLSDELHAYVVAHSCPPDPLIADLIAETLAVLPAESGMQIAPEQSGFLTLFTRLLGVRRAAEVGTFTGLSSISIARGMADDGVLTCFDISEEYTSIARKYWARAGLTDKIELRIGSAAEKLRELPAEEHLDLAFIDADKASYPTYWAELVPRMRPGGVILLDNVLRHGRIVAPQSPDDHAMVAFNDAVLADERVDSVLLPLADGLTIARKR
ncbi:class I SAM-dependent methyltransferase [Luedemannella flava]|uniref:Class I SAM-dependent methyltransferase n=1 Tax=Luedemannella flava TaxID=349316 RepID=A0ABN2LG84_9ACTN